MGFAKHNKIAIQALRSAFIVEPLQEVLNLLDVLMNLSDAETVCNPCCPSARTLSQIL